MANNIDTERKIIYNLLNRLLPLNSILTPSFSKTVKHNGLSIAINNLDNNTYFSTIQLSQFGKQTDTDIFDELVIRVWNNKQAEVVSIRQAHFDIYEETFFKRNGIEHSRPEIREQAHQFLFSWLRTLEQQQFSL